MLKMATLKSFTRRGFILLSVEECILGRVNVAYFFYVFQYICKVFKISIMIIIFYNYYCYYMD